MSSLIVPYSNFSCEMHRIQEEALQQLENQFPEEKNLKIKLTYKRALSELYNLSKMPKYRKYFDPMLGLPPFSENKTYKVLGAWMDKVGGDLRIALLSHKYAVVQWDYKLSLKLINISVEDSILSGEEALPKSKSLLLYNQGTLNPTPNFPDIFNENRGNLNNFNIYLEGANGESFDMIDINFIFENKNTLFIPDISPQDAYYTYVEDRTHDKNAGVTLGSPIYHEIKKVDFNHCNLSYVSDEYGEERENRHRYFFIDYNEIKHLVNQPSNPLKRMGKNAMSFITAPSVE